MLYKNLSEEEKEKLLKFPAYVSLLTANADGQMNDSEKKGEESIKSYAKHVAKAHGNHWVFFLIPFVNWD